MVADEVICHRTARVVGESTLIGSVDIANPPLFPRSSISLIASDSSGGIGTSMYAVDGILWTSSSAADKGQKTVQEVLARVRRVPRRRGRLLGI